MTTETLEISEDMSEDMSEELVSQDPAFQDLVSPSGFLFGTGDLCTCCGKEIELGAGPGGSTIASCECCSGAVLA